MSMEIRGIENHSPIYVFAVGDRVQVDGVEMTVTAVMIRGHKRPAFAYECTWMNGRQACVQWLESAVVKPLKPESQMVLGFGPVPTRENDEGTPKSDEQPWAFFGGR